MFFGFREQMPPLKKKPDAQQQRLLDHIDANATEMHPKAASATLPGRLPAQSKKTSQRASAPGGAKPRPPGKARFNDLVVEVPATSHAHDGDEGGGEDVFVDFERGDGVQVNKHHGEDDVDESAVRNTWITAPCNCCLAIWASLGEMIEGGAEQIVGLLLFPLSILTYFYFAVADGALDPMTWIEGSTCAWLGLIGAGCEGAGGGDDADAAGAPPPPPWHPSWSELANAAGATYAMLHPVLYVALDIGLLLGIALLVLFEADLYRCYRDCRSRRYEEVDEMDEAEQGANLSASASTLKKYGKAAVMSAAFSKPVRMMRERTLRNELHKAIDTSEELYLQKMVRTSTQSDEDDEDDEQLAQQMEVQRARQSQLQAALSRNHSFKTSPERFLKRTRTFKGSWCEKMRHSSFIQVFRRSLNGLVNVWLYFADLISDIEVTVLLFSSSQWALASIASVFLFLQFFVVWLRVLPYLHDTFGPESGLHRFFAVFGFPLGMLGLDCLMFLEPFGLLPVVPCLTDQMRQFIPAYKATRIIAEVLIESLPQMILQSYIMVTVFSRVHAGMATETELSLLSASIDGAPFSEILPRSIAISTITSLKAWIELVHSAREAGITVREKANQLLKVGYGLPLDALKRGAIYEWSCEYQISEVEVPPLLDALIKNSSLTRLNLSKSGFEWNGPEASKAFSGAPLIEALAESASALAELQNLVVSQESGYAIPVGKLRKGGEIAKDALHETRLLRPGGPRLLEVLLIGDLLRKDRSKSLVDQHKVEESASKVVALIERAKRGEVNVDAWQTQVVEMIVAGELRRAHLKGLFTVRVLHDVGFEPKQLLALGHRPIELKEAGYSAKDLMDKCDIKLSALKALGYKVKDLKAADATVHELKALGFGATALKDEAEYGLLDLKDASFTLDELKAAGFGPSELKLVAGYKAPELRLAGFTASELRSTKAFVGPELREAGYSATELRAAGYDCKFVIKAGYNTTEATEAGYTLPQLVAAGCECKPLKEAGWKAPEMRKAGFQLNHLDWAGYDAQELQAAGFDAAMLKESGIGLLKLKKAGTPIAKIREAGFKADRLKLEGYKAGELAKGGYSAKELRGFRDQLYAEGEGAYAGYTAKEMHDSQVEFSAKELIGAGYTCAELRDGGYTAGELKAKGASLAEMRGGGYTCAELLQGGFTVEQLKIVASAKEMTEAGVSPKMLRAVGYSVNLLRKAGVTAAALQAAGCTNDDLFKGGFDAKELWELGLRVRELKGIGVSVAELRQLGCKAKLLGEVGFTAAELIKGGFNPREVEAVQTSADGVASVSALRAKGYSAAELRMIGFQVADMRSGGYTCRQVREGGFTQEELLEGGFRQRSVDATDGRPVSTLRVEGRYYAKDLAAIGFATQEMFEGGYSTKELTEIGVGVAELKAAGASAGALREAGVAGRDLKAAGYTLRQLREGGFAWKELVIFLRSTHAELVEAGFAGLDPKDMIFKQYRPE